MSTFKSVGAQDPDVSTISSFQFVLCTAVYSFVVNDWGHKNKNQIQMQMGVCPLTRYFPIFSKLIYFRIGSTNKVRILAKCWIVKKGIFKQIEKFSKGCYFKMAVIKVNI